LPVERSFESVVDLFVVAVAVIVWIIWIVGGGGVGVGNSVGTVGTVGIVDGLSAMVRSNELNRGRILGGLERINTVLMMARNGSRHGEKEDSRQREQSRIERRSW